MKITQVRCFCEVVDTGTLARAAERMHIAPTAISMQIAQLEQELGGELFDRSVKPMALTALGRFFLPRAHEFLSIGERLEQDTKDMATGRQGWLGIGFVRSLIYSVVPAAVQAFRREHPEVKLELIELLSISRSSSGTSASRSACRATSVPSSTCPGWATRCCSTTRSWPPFRCSIRWPDATPPRSPSLTRCP